MLFVNINKMIMFNCVWKLFFHCFHLWYERKLFFFFFTFLLWWGKSEDQVFNLVWPNVIFLLHAGSECITALRWFQFTRLRKMWSKTVSNCEIVLLVFYAKKLVLIKVYLIFNKRNKQATHTDVTSY